MRKRICPVCGLILTADATNCPCCKQALPQRGKPPIDLQEAHIKLYNYLLPAMQGEEGLGSCCKKIENWLKDQLRILGIPNYDVLEKIVKEEYADIQRGIKAVQDHNARVASQAYARFNATMQSSEYQGLGFSAITDGAGAVAYALVDALEHYAHDVTVSQVAYKNLIADMQRMSSSSGNRVDVDRMLKTVDKVIWLMGAMLDIKYFAEENPDFYKSSVGYTDFHGVYLKDVFSGEAASTSFWRMKPIESQAFCSALEVAGYITVCSSFYGTTGNTKFITTGKYEAELIRQRYKKEHPKEISAYNKDLARLAQEALLRKDYYTAATYYAQVENDADALRKSISIWNEHLQHMQPVSAGYMLGANGDALHLHLHRVATLLPSEEPFRQIKSCADKGCVALTFDGRIQSDDQNIYGGEKDGKCLPGNGAQWRDITAIDCSGAHLVALCADGTVRAVGKNGQDQCDVKAWSGVAQVKAVGDSTAAITDDGRVLLAGRIKKCANAWQSWTNIRQVYLLENKKRSGVVAVTADGKVLVDGEVSFEQADLTKWHDVVRICWFDSGIFGITTTGGVFFAGESGKLKEFCGQLKGVVKIVHYASGASVDKFVGLKADGTVITAGIPLDTGEWQRVVDVECHNRPYESGLNLCAVTAYGEVLTAGNDYMQPEEVWKPFDHVDNFLRIQKQTVQAQIAKAQQELAETKGLFAGGKRKELQRSIDFMQSQYRWDD